MLFDSTERNQTEIKNQKELRLDDYDIHLNKGAFVFSEGSLIADAVDSNRI